MEGPAPALSGGRAGGAWARLPTTRVLFRSAHHRPLGHKALGSSSECSSLQLTSGSPPVQRRSVLLGTLGAPLTAALGAELAPPGPASAASKVAPISAADAWLASDEAPRSAGLPPPVLCLQLPFLRGGGVGGWPWRGGPALDSDWTSPAAQSCSTALLLCPLLLLLLSHAGLCARLVACRCS